MQHKIKLTLLALAAAATNVQAQSSSLELYGVVDVGVVSLDGVGDKTRRFVSSGSQMGSRLGLRGTEQISPGWQARFTIEHQLYADTGDQNQQDVISGGVIPERAFYGVPATIRARLQPQLLGELNRLLKNKFWHRQAWVGVVTPGGALLAGRQYSPVFATFGRFDPHLAGNVGNAFATLTVPEGLEPRIDNALQYVAETGGFRLNAMVAAGEGEVGKGRFWGLSAGYAVGGFDFGIGHQQRTTSEGRKSLQNTIVGASYETGPFKFHAMWLRAHDEHPVLGPVLRKALNEQIPAGALRDAFLSYGTRIVTNLGYDGELIYGGLHYKLNPHNKLVLSYGSYDDKREGINSDAAIAGVALEHIKSKRTSIWLSGGYVDNKSTQQILPYSQGLMYGFTDRPGRDSSAWSVNLLHRF